MFKEVLDRSRSLPWKIGNKVLPCKTPLIMGIVNVTPDSFFDGGKHNKPDAAYEHALKRALESDGRLESTIRRRMEDAKKGE